MHGELSAVTVLREALAGRPSPLWTIESRLFDLALADTKYGSDAARRILRLARERAAAAASPVTSPTIDELRAAIDGTPEERLATLIQLFLHDITKGAGLADGGHGPPGAGRGG